jgi:hypothetical protein
LVSLVALERSCTPRRLVRRRRRQRSTASTRCATSRGPEGTALIVCMLSTSSAIAAWHSASASSTLRTITLDECSVAYQRTVCTSSTPSPASSSDCATRAESRMKSSACSRMSSTSKTSDWRSEDDTGRRSIRLRPAPHAEVCCRSAGAGWDLTSGEGAVASNEERYRSGHGSLPRKCALSRRPSASRTSGAGFRTSPEHLCRVASPFSAS